MPQLQFFDRVVVQLLHRDRYTVQTVQKSVEILQVQFLDWLGHPLLYNDRCLGLTVQKTVEVPQVQYSDRVVDVPAVAVHRQGLDVSVISHDVIEGLFLRFFRIFRAPPGCPGEERQSQPGSPR